MEAAAAIKVSDLPLPELVLPLLAAEDLGRLACCRKALREQVATLDVDVWRKTAANSLSPSHPVLRDGSVAAILQALRYSKQAGAQLCKGKFSSSSTLHGAHLPVFSPCGTIYAVLEPRSSDPEKHKRRKGSKNPSAPGNWSVSIFAVRDNAAMASVLLNIQPAAAPPIKHGEDDLPEGLRYMAEDERLTQIRFSSDAQRVVTANYGPKHTVAVQVSDACTAAKLLSLSVPTAAGKQGKRLVFQLSAEGSFLAISYDSHYGDDVDVLNLQGQNVLHCSKTWLPASSLFSDQYVILCNASGQRQAHELVTRQAALCGRKIDGAIMSAWHPFSVLFTVVQQAGDGYKTVMYSPSGELLAIHQHVFLDSDECGNCDTVSLSPNLAFRVVSELESPDFSAGPTKVYDPITGTVLADISPQLPDRQTYTTWSMAWSPNSRFVAFFLSVPYLGLGDTGLWVLDTCSWSVKLVYNDNKVISGVTWSPDGCLVALEGSTRQEFAVRLVRLAE